MCLCHNAMKGYRLPRHQEDSPPTTPPPSKVTSAHGLKNEEYTSFGGELVGGEIPWWQGDWIPYEETE